MATPPSPRPENAAGAAGFLDSAIIAGDSHGYLQTLREGTTVSEDAARSIDFALRKAILPVSFREAL
jgi:hypothetical protein